MKTRIETEPDYGKPCSLCKNKVVGFGHNPWPLRDPGSRCCDDCNDTLVIPARLALVFSR